MLHVVILAGLPYAPPKPTASDARPIAIRFSPAPATPQTSAPAPTPTPDIPKPQKTTHPAITETARKTEIARPVKTIDSPPEITPPPTTTRPPAAQPEKPSPPTIAEPARPTGMQLIANAVDLIQNGPSQTETLTLPGQDGPRRTYIDRSTREPRFAGYMDAWVKKVERVGNLNYPVEIRRKRLSGHLTLDVCIRGDGSVESIDILRPSQHPELDRAALNIVRMAAPYAPLPENIRADTDILHITRVWRFGPDHHWAYD